MIRTRPSPQSGIAIGVILFVLALLAVVATAFNASSRGFNGALVNADRISADLRSQGDLIRNKIRECYMNINKIDSSGNYYNSSNYPTSTGTGTLVEALNCPTYGAGNQNLWTGQSQILLPQPTKGMGKWYYVNAGDANGRCIRTQPDAEYVNDQVVRQGLSQAASGFSDLERTYDSNSSSQRFIIWITRPTGAASADCSS